jgi:hypothetical protein
MHRAVEAAQRHLTSRARCDPKNSEFVRDLSIAELRALVVEATQVASQRNRNAQLIFNTVGFFDIDANATFEDHVRWAYQSIRDFIGQSFPASLRSQANGWRYIFTATTTAGSWHGYALHQEPHADGMPDLYRQCLLLRINADEVIIAAALVESVKVAHRALGLSSWTRESKNTFALVGQAQLGDAIPEG